jgi:RNA recognition motif-containing protein
VVNCDDWCPSKENTSPERGPPSIQLNLLSPEDDQSGILPEYDLEKETRRKTMSTNIYVGNLSFDSTESDIRELFEEHGTVDEVKMITDRDTGRPRGFGFIVMSSGGDEAIRALDGKDLGGRNLKVNEARPREDRGSRY